MPLFVFRGVPLVYSKDSPGLIVGNSPTTPSPWTFIILPLASIINQFLWFNLIDESPELVMFTWYAQTKWLSCGDDWSSKK